MYHILYRGTHPRLYWDGDGWTGDKTKAAHYAPDDLPEVVPSVGGGYDLERCELLYEGHPGTYEPSEEYMGDYNENPDDQQEYLVDEYRESLYRILLRDDEEEEDEGFPEEYIEMEERRG